MTPLPSRFGINSKTSKSIFENYIKDNHDFIIIDSHRPEKRIRKDLFEVIDIKI